MSMWQGTDGYYYQQHGDGTPYFIGTDGSYHPVIQIQDTTGQFNSARGHVAAFLGYMMQRNNTFLNSAGENVEFTRAIIITGLHTSTATADPHSNRGIRHYGIQLTNDGLFADDGSTHLLHFRPHQIELSFFYSQARTRTQNTKFRNKTKDRTSKGGKRDPPGPGSSSKSDGSLSSKGKSSSKGSTSKASSSRASQPGSKSSNTSHSKRHASPTDCHINANSGFSHGQNGSH